LSTSLISAWQLKNERNMTKPMTKIGENRNMDELGEL
jgi:hypothetical protein